MKNIRTAAIIVTAYGILTFLGGVIGFVLSSSLMSLVMGSIFGILLILSGVLIYKKRVYASYSAIVLSLLLAGFFIPRFIKTMHFFPAGLMALCSLVIVSFLILQGKPLRN